MLITARDDGFNGGVNDDDDINDETVKKKKIQQPKNPKAIFDRNSKLLGAYSILLLSVQARPVNCNYFHSPRNLFNCTNFQRKKKYILNWNEWSLLIKPKKIEKEWKHKYALKSKLDFYCFVSFGTQLFSDFCQCISSLSSNNNNNNKKNTHTHSQSHFSLREDLLAISQIFTFHNSIPRKRFFSLLDSPSFILIATHSHNMFDCCFATKEKKRIRWTSK